MTPFFFFCMLWWSRPGWLNEVELSRQLRFIHYARRDCARRQGAASSLCFTNATCWWWTLAAIFADTFIWRGIQSTLHSCTSVNRKFPHTKINYNEKKNLFTWYYLVFLNNLEFQGWALDVLHWYLNITTLGITPDGLSPHHSPIPQMHGQALIAQRKRWNPHPWDEDERQNLQMVRWFQDEVHPIGTIFPFLS